MTCTEFQSALPDYLEGGPSEEHRKHVEACSACSLLVSDLNFISQQAQTLAMSAEPSPRVWNSIEIALRQEGVLRPPGREAATAKAFPRWRMAWVVPVAALLFVGSGVLLRTRVPHPASTTGAQVAVVPDAARADSAPPTPAVAQVASQAADDQLLQLVSARNPAALAAYRADLQNVNAYIRDAEQSARIDPNDEEVQQSLMDAYEQRATVYELAMDRSLP